MDHTDLQAIRAQFMTCFGNYGFIEVPSVKISSKADPSTTYIGSGISTLKKYILSQIPSSGIMVDQPSMRFRELKKLFDPMYLSQYGAFFNNMGLITPSQDIDTLCEQLHSYFTDYLEIPEESLVARVSSKDAELLKTAKKRFQNLEIDSMPDRYYRHVIGIEGYTGMNFNVAIQNKTTGKLEDTGNLLVFQKDGEHAFLEIGLGDTVIQKPLMGYEHVLDCYHVTSPQKLNKIQRLNYINSIIVSTVLYREGLEASSRDTQRQILQKYVKYLSALHLHNLVTYEDIEESISSFERNYYTDDKTVKDDIVLTLRKKEELYAKDVLKV
jgi:hypothetical protein